MANYAWGIQKEKELQPLLEYCCNDKLIKTEERYCAVDFYCEQGDYFVELKARKAHDKWGRKVNHDTYTTWFVPCTKRAIDKPVYLFYYFEGDETLWFLQYDEDKFSKYETGIPPGHLTNQLHWFIPKEEWECCAGYLCDDTI